MVKCLIGNAKYGSLVSKCFALMTASSNLDILPTLIYFKILQKFIKILINIVFLCVLQKFEHALWFECCCYNTLKSWMEKKFC